MPLNDRDAWALLRELDDPNYLEFPRGYVHAAARSRFNELVTSLSLAFDCTCKVNREIQDASYHGTIVIPDNATASPEHITVIVSNFGNLATVTLGNPGDYDPEEERELLLPNDQDRVSRLLDELGYVAIRQHLLEAAYRGTNDSLKAATAGHEPTWWTRYFDYI